MPRRAPTSTLTGMIVRLLRKSQGLSQRELMRRARWQGSPSKLSTLETGVVRGLHPRRAVALARALGACPMELAAVMARDEMEFSRRSF